MKVLLMDVNCQYSSTGKIVYDLYEQLRSNGHEAGIAYGRGPLVEGENIYRFSPQWEVWVHALLTRLTGYTGCFSPIATYRLFRYIDKFQPDVVHLHDMHGYFVNICALVKYLKRKDIKAIWTFHCEFMYTGKCGHSKECAKWETQCGNCPYLNEYPQSFLLDQTRRMFRQKRKAFEGFNKLVIVSPSEWLSSRIRRSFLKGKEISTIYNGIDTDIFCPQNAEDMRVELGMGERKIVLAVAPNIMSANKGGRYVLAIAEEMPDVNFIMVGAKDVDMEVPSNVKVFGLVKDQNRLAKLYSLADVFLICSERENYPTTCVEAASCGTPVVGFDVGGTSETVDAPYGKFVEYSNISEVKNAIESFLADDVKKGMVETRDYSKKRMFLEYLKVYEK